MYTKVTGWFIAFLNFVGGYQFDFYDWIACWINQKNVRKDFNVVFDICCV